MTPPESVYSEGFISNWNESCGLLFLLIGISFRNWKLEMLRFLKNKLSRISAAHHFYLVHFIIHRWLCWRFRMFFFWLEVKIPSGETNLLGLWEFPFLPWIYLSVGKECGCDCGLFHTLCDPLLLLLQNVWYLSGNQSFLFFVLFFFFFVFAVRQDFQIFNPTLLRTKVEVKPVVIVFTYFIFMEGVSMVKLIFSNHKRNMNCQFLIGVLWVFSTICFPRFLGILKEMELCLYLCNIVSNNRNYRLFHAVLRHNRAFLVAISWLLLSLRITHHN